VSSFEPASNAALFRRAKRSRTARRVPPAAFALAGGALALEVTTHLLDFGADFRIPLLDSASEWSWSHIVATVAFAAATLAGVAGARRAGRLRSAWQVLAVLFGFLFLDNVSRLHTQISAWPVIYAPILLVVSGAAWRVARGTREAPVVGAGLATLLVSLGVHVLGPQVVHVLGWTSHSWAYQVKVALKEGTELAGWVLVVPALWRLAMPRVASR
jgi:hypothetical protein